MALRDITDHDREVAEALLEELGGRTAFAFASISGSLAAGLAHNRSDLDIHVVQRVPSPIKAGYTVGDQFVQLSVHSQEEFSEYAAFLDIEEATPEDRGPFGMSLQTLWPVHRLVIGEILFSDPNVRHVVDRLDKRNLRRLSMGIHAITAARSSDDATGLMESSDLRCAYDVATQALRSACEVSLAATGDFYAAPKFLIARLERSSAHVSVLPAIFEYLRAPEFISAECCVNTIHLAQYLIAYSVINSWDEEVASIPAPVNISAYSRSPQFGLVRYPSAWSLAGGKKSFRVNARFAQTWFDLHQVVPEEAALEQMLRLGVAQCSDEMR